MCKQQNKPPTWTYPCECIPRQSKTILKVCLKFDKSATIHMKNLYFLTTEIHKIKSDISADIMKDIFTFQKN